MSTRRTTRGGTVRMALVALLVAAPAVGSAVLPGGSAQAQQHASAFEQTKELVNARDGAKTPASVSVSQTTNLFNRQQVEIDLAGFRPTRNASSTQNVGVYMEYPVVVMQCRGAAPTPQTCLNERRDVWYAGHDAQASADLKARVTRMTGPETLPNTVPEAERLKVHQLPFEAIDGISYLWHGAQVAGKPLIDEETLKSGLPPDASAGGAALVATRSIAIDKDGNAEFPFEVRERVSQASTGCTDTQACSLVVVPIMDIACATTAPAECTAPPKGEPPGTPGSSISNSFYGPRAWFAHSNWENRFVVPLTFAPDANKCDVADPRPNLPVYGSELVDVAQQRWGVAYCQGATAGDFLPGYIQGSEYLARQQFSTKLGPRYQQNGVVITEPIAESVRPVAHAPSAITGFAVAFTIDDGNGRQVTDLTLSPRLLAKLLTESYSPNAKRTDVEGRTFYTGQPITSQADADKYFWQHNGIVNNPRNLYQDEEFLALNPDLEMETPRGTIAGQFSPIAKTFPVVFTVRSDIMMELTRYVLSDPAARAWIDGAPDEQGMVVNPAWRGATAFEGYNLRDVETQPKRPRKSGWQENGTATNNYYTLIGAGSECNDFSPSPMLTQLANIANNAESAATALLDRRGSALPICTVSFLPGPGGTPQFPGDDPTKNMLYTPTKSDPAEYGQQSLISITTVAHAELYELPSAKLVNAGGQAVAPAPGTMLNALAAAEQDPVNGTVLIDHARVTGNNAYPGTMLAFTAVATSGLDLTTAGHYADFIEFMATDGQTPGDALTNLPPGYDPLTPNLREQALNAAAAIRAQAGEIPPPPAGGPLGDGLPEGFGGPNGQLPVAGPGGTTGPQSAEESDEKTKRASAETDGDASWLSRWAFPLLVAFGLVAAAAAGTVRIWGQPDHPVRRALRSVVRR